MEGGEVSNSDDIYDLKANEQHANQNGHREGGHFEFRSSSGPRTPPSVRALE